MKKRLADANYSAQVHTTLHKETAVTVKGTAAETVSTVLPYIN